MKKKQTYDEALQALENIIDQLENANLSVDELTEKVKEATNLITFCKKQLHETDETVAQLFDQIGE